MDNLFEQMANISKAHAYDIVSEIAQYWEKRCKAAEKCYDLLNLGEPHKNEYAEWKELKDQEFKRLLK